MKACRNSCVLFFMLWTVFAFFPHQRLARMPMGRARLQEELLATGCSESIVQATVGASYRKVSEQDLAMQVVATAGKLTSPQMLGRVARLLNQRGFGEDTIETVMARIGNVECSIV